MDNPSSPPLLQPPNPSQPQPSPTTTTTSSNPPSPDIKPKLELVPTSNSTPNSNNPTPTSPAKKTPPLPWTHQETISLIQAYQDKWYSLKKGQLKASQWEEVSAAVSARCGYDVPSKSAIQCRHKIEKLRKRYRAERIKPYPNSWQYFELMDRMERGPLPISAARPVAAVKYQNNANSAAAGGGVDNYNESDSEEGDANYGGHEVKKNKLKSINNIVRGGDIGGVSGSNNSNRNVNIIGMNRNFGGVGESMRVLRGLRTPMNQKRKGYFHNDESDDDEEDELEEEEEEETEGVVGRELASEIRGFAERFMRMEGKKIEMMRETQRCRMEMEKKRMDMILEAQRKVVDTIARAFGAHKKAKMAQEI